MSRHGGAKARTCFGVTHYKSTTFRDVVSQTNVRVVGSGNNKYVEVKEGSFSPFELGDPKAANTGDTGNMSVYMALLEIYKSYGVGKSDPVIIY